MTRNAGQLALPYCLKLRRLECRKISALQYNISHSNIARRHANMTIELEKETRQEAIKSIERYFIEHMEEPIGNLQAGALLGFILEEIGPSIYNKAILDAQERLQQRVLELDIEIHEKEFGYWGKNKRPR